MTARRSSEHWLDCNGWYDEGGTYHYCGTQFRDPPGLDHFARPAELRKLAALEGWLFERHRLGRLYDKDRCPECKERHSPGGHAVAIAAITARREAEARDA